MTEVPSGPPIIEGPNPDGPGGPQPPVVVVPPGAISQHIAWIALPNGRAGAFGRLSVYLSPRARAISGTPAPYELRSYGDFRDWQPADLAFDVVVGDETIPARITSETDPRLWTLLFRPSTPVRAHAMDRRSHLPIHSYALGDLVSWLRSSYAQLATTDDVPSPSASAQQLAAAAFSSDPEIPSDVDDLDTWIGQELQRNGAIRSDAPSFDDRKNLHLVRRFHQPLWEVDGVLEDDGTYSSLRRPERPLSTAPEFHEVLALLNSHPELLRKLGLVVDVEFPLGPATGLDPVDVRVVPRFTSSEPVHNITPATRTHLVAFRAAPASADGPIGGHLRLGTRGAYDVVTVDADGSAMKAMSFASELQYRALRSRDRAALRDKQAPPALRSAGLQLAQRDRAAALRERFEATEALDDGLVADHAFPQALTAEDVTRGLRPDVFEAPTGRWRSLVARTATYDVADGAFTAEVEDEGIVTAGVTMTEGKPQLGLRVGESLFQWTGWSLAASRPGRAVGIGDDEFPTRNGEYPDPERTTSDELPVALDVRARPGTLPRLRFGWSYRLRARTVDLAGNSVSIDDAIDAAPLTTPLTPYGRFEPVEHPVILSPRRRTPGEDIERMVVRSSDFAGTNETTSECERHFAPPKSSQLLAEQHGMFDVRSGDTPLDRAAYAVIARREANSFAQTYDPDTGDFVQHGLPEGDAADGVRFFPDLLDDRSVPYLPDPMAKRLWLRGLPNLSAGAAGLSFPGRWPEASTIRLRLRKGDAADARAEGDEVIVALAPAERRTIRVSCAPLDADADAFGQFQWVQQERPADAAALRRRIAAGAAWAVTPWRTIELVHAVRQPLVAPSLDQPVAERLALGATQARIRGLMAFSRPSTSRVDALATWSDPVDEGPGTGQPFDRPQERLHAFTIPLDRDREEPDDTEYLVRDLHELGDTKHHEITYELEATTAFPEYFTRRATFTWTGAAIRLPALGEGIVGSSVRVRDERTGTPYEAGRDYAVEDSVRDGDGGIRSPQQASSRIPAQSRVTVTWLPRPTTRIGDRIGPLHVPASTRPLPPSVRSVVPAFRWASTTEGSLASSIRQGGALRVVLDRPWWSSGGEEMLGVLLLRQPGGVPEGQVPDDAVPYASQIGHDPTISGRGELPLLLRPEHFAGPGRRTHQEALALPELPGRTFDVVGHPVEFDAERDAWVSDIQLTAGTAYRPFVRLGLVRYQPFAIAGAHLSTVALTDFHQLEPNRSVVVQRRSAAAADITLTGPDPTTRGDVTGSPSFARAILETLRYPEAGDAGWQEVRRVELSRNQTSVLSTWRGTLIVGGLDNSPKRIVVEQGERVARGRSTQRDAIYGERLVHQDIVALPPAPFGGRGRLGS